MKGVTILSVAGDGLPCDGGGDSAATTMAHPLLPLPPSLGRIVYANATFEEMSGRSSSQLLGSSLDVLLGPDSDPVQVSRLREALISQLPDTLRLQCYHSAGGTFWNSLSVAPISNASALRQLASSREAGRHPRDHQALVQDLDQGPSPSPSSKCPTPPAGAEGAVSGGGASRSSFVIVLHEDVSRMVSEQAGFRLRDQALHSCAEGITIVDPSLPDNPIVYCNDAFLQMTG